MSNKNSRFKSNSMSNRKNNRARFGRNGHLIKGARVRSSAARRDEILLPENSALLERNLEDAINFSSLDFVEELERDLLLDQDVSNAFDNTLVVNDWGEPVNDAAQKSAYRAVIHVAIDDTTRMVIENQEEPFSEKEFASEVKNNALERLDNLRTEAEAEKEEQNKVIEEAKEEKSFFGRLRDKFSRKIEVSGKSIINMFETAKRDMQEYTEQIAEKAPTVKSKVLANKWHQCKTKIAAVAVVAMSAFSIGCSNSSNTPQPQQAPVDTLEQVVDTATIVVTSPVPTVTLSAVEDTIKVPTEYSDSLGVSQSAFKSTVKFDNNSFTQQVDDSTTIEGFAFAYKRVAEVMSQIKNCVASDSLANDSVAQTPMQVLNSHRYIRSMYPNPDRMEKLGIKDSVLIEAAKTAKELDQFLNDCTDTIPQNISSMFAIEQIPGNMNVYATGIESPCDDAKVQYKKTNIPQTLEENVDVPVDTTSIQKDFDALDSVLETDTITTYNDSIVSGFATLNKSNENFSDHKLVRPAQVSEFTDLEVKSDKTVLAEQGENNSEVDDFVEVSEESASPEVDATQTTFDDITDVNNVAPVALVDVEQTTFDDIEEADVTTPVDSIQTEFDDFVEVADSTIAASDQAIQNIAQALSTDSVTTEILFDSDSIAPGTLAAGYVAERGGYNNSGAALKDIKYSKRILGEDVYQALYQPLSEAFSDDGAVHQYWFGKNGVFGGLTPEEALIDITVMNVTGPNQETTTALMEAILCNEKMSAEIETKVKADVAGIHINKTRDGWTYNKPVYVSKVNDNGCGKKRTLNKVKTDDASETKASGPKYPRLFKKTTVVRQTAFDELPSVLDIVNEESNDSIVNATYTLVKSNENFTDSKVVRSASEEEVTNREISSDKQVYVQSNENAPKRKASVMRKRIAKVTQRYEKQAKEAGLTGNLDIDMKTAEGSKFAQEFLAKNKMKAETIVEQQTKAKVTAYASFGKAADSYRG